MRGGEGEADRENKSSRIKEILKSSISKLFSILCPGNKGTRLRNSYNKISLEQGFKKVLINGLKKIN